MFLFVFIQILNKKCVLLPVSTKTTLAFEWNHKIFACIEFQLVDHKQSTLSHSTEKNNQFQFVILNGTGLSLANG